VAVGALGVVIDMRENGGGSGFLGDQLPAYFFDDEYLIGKTARYSAARGDFAINEAENDEFILPANDLYYDGAVAVIISPNCASACESFAYAMTVNQRAAIIGEYPTAGLGGSVVPIALPDDTSFNYTNSRSLTADGTIAIEGLGVQPTILVPVTEATLFGEQDALLEAALGELRTALNFIALGDVVTGEVQGGIPVRYRLPIKMGERFGIEVRSQTPDSFTPALRLYVPGTSEAVLDDIARRSGIANLNGLSAPFDVTLIVEIGADDDAASGTYTLEIFDDN
ncbi:MAG: hypothetical protein H7Y11_08380, partial [Armatimonadetes bacterium]|nr:hypothetical protein [Anaerolineae bacterium]